MNTIHSKIVKKGIFLLFAVISLNSLHAQANEDAIIGIWETEMKDAKMEIFKSAGEYQAKLLWGKEIVNADGSSKKDVNNPDTKLQNRELIGIIYLKGLQFRNDQWEKGRVYNNSNGEWYKCYVWLKDGQLNLRGYLGMKILGQTSVWNKSKKPEIK